MSTNKIFLAVIIGSMIILAGCRKAKTDTDSNEADPNARQHNEDVSNTKTESDNLNTDINSLLREVSGFGKNESVMAYAICGASVDSSHQYDPIPTVTITFDGTTPCGNPSRIRGGQVKIELIQGSSWSAVGAKLKITHSNYKVTFVALSSHYVTFNGIKYLTNVDGFDWFNYYFTGALTSRIRERSNDMTVTFENGQTDLWNSARISTWVITGYSNITATVNGDSISGGKTIDSWGTTRFGTHFTTEMITPWKSGTACGWWKPTQGKYTSTTDNFSVTATFGVDQSGHAVTSGCSAYGIKLEWDYFSGSVSGNAVIPYF